MLRQLFSILWLENYGTAAPIEFEKVMSLVTENQILDEVNLLLERKKVSEEKMLAPAIPALNRYIENQLSRLENIKVPKTNRISEMEQLNWLFQAVLKNNY
ncbi:nucleotidyltransferase domain-containing protein [Reinekea marina]|uniref:DNA polymerase beta superfamily protein n=1 Tax=Reinekea marina TaxID=1310421 RepID=UPI0025B337CB|nr:nucleotidyltransferase domain-containing protein [Reinekea marina]MDN3647889.1 nucleotidyltransferase domain-containing protein [Reinekea marina]